jgi:hypothetical protein
MRMWAPLLVALVACGSKEDAFPVADAGGDQVVTPGVSIDLDGSASSDRDGRIKNYAWTLLSAPSASRSSFDGSGPTPAFTVDEIGRYVFSLVVTDDAGNASYPDLVEVVAVTPAERPVAHLETTGDLGIGLPITLNGELSTAPEGHSLSSWNFSLLHSPDGGSASLESGDETYIATFTPDVAGVWIAGLEVFDGELASRVTTVELHVSDQVNQPPVAVCGGDQAVVAGTTVYVDGSASLDPEGEPLTYLWDVSGPSESTAIMIADGSTIGRFVADTTGEYLASLTVSDGRLFSSPCTASISVQPNVDNRAPVAHAGGDTAVDAPNLAVNLDGSDSFDPDADPLEYRWHLLSTPPSSVLSDSAFETADREATLFSPDTIGPFLVALEVCDPSGLCSTDSAQVLVGAGLNQPPVANAGPDGDIEIRVDAALNGSNSTDPDGDALSYAWSILTRPDGSTALLSGSDEPITILTPDVDGDYVLRLVVSDGELTDSDMLTLTVHPEGTPLAPVCGEIADRVTDMGIPVEVSAEGTIDPNGDELDYSWAVTSGPDGAAPVFDDPNTEVTAFTPDLPGIYRVSMRATDSTASCTVDFAVTAIDTTPNLPPVCDAGGDLLLELGDTAILDGSATADPDEDELSFQWLVYEGPGSATPDIDSATSAIARFTPDVAGVYTLSFTASDEEESCSEWIVLDVQVPEPNTPPICSLDSTGDVLIGETASFDASGSIDPDGDELDITWVLDSSPETSSEALLSDEFTASIRTDAAGTYVVSIVVSDGEDTCSASTSIVATSGNAVPVCDLRAPAAALVGEIVTLDASGSTDADGDSLGFTWSVNSRPDASSATLTDPMATVTQFVPDIAGSYGFEVVVTDGTDTCTTTATLTVTSNEAPICDAGPDLDVPVGEFVNLDGTATSDPDGDALSYYWYVIERPEGSVSGVLDRDTPTARFLPDIAGTYVFDDGLESCDATVTVTATSNVPPACDAGTDQEGLVGEFVELDGTGTTDEDGDTLTYYWYVLDRPEGSVSGLLNRDTSTPRFQPDMAGSYTFEVTADDGTESCSDTITLTVTSNSPPSCDAGTDIEGLVGSFVSLNGSATDDDDDPLTYYWSVLDRPEGSVAGLLARDTATPRFQPDILGSYTFEVTVDDGTESCSDTVTLTASDNFAPVCEAGPDQESTRYEGVTLDGSATTDPDGDTLTYYWYVTERPEGSVHGLIGRESAVASFFPDKSGTYVFEITADDGTEGCSDTITLTVTGGEPPVCSAGEDFIGEIAVRSNLDGTETFDPDGEALSYYWYVVERPEGSTNGLITRTSVTPGFIPDIGGEYTFQITATDGEDSCADEVQMTVPGSGGGDDTASPPGGDDSASPPGGDDTGTPPGPGDLAADAGRDQNLCDIASIDLDGTDSSGGGLSYTWTFDSTPDGSTISDADIAGAGSALASFTPDAEGRFVVELLVTDGTFVDTDTVAIVVDTDGSVLALHLDEGGGSSTVDSSPYANDSDFLDGEWTGGRFFTGMSFDGSNHIAIADAEQLDIETDLTIDWWMQTGDIGTDWRAILTKGTTENYNYSLWTYQDELHFYGVDTTGAYVSTSAVSSTLGDGIWHHYAISVTDSTMTLYEDGIVLSSDGFSNPLRTNETDLYIGRPAYSSTLDTFVGAVDEVVIRNNALSASDIAFIATADTQYCTGDDDSRSPDGEITNPGGPTSTDIGYVKVEGSASDESAIAAVSVNGSAAAATSDNYATWVAYVPLDEGSNTLILQVEDVAGNVNSSADSVAVEREDFCGDETVLLLAFDEDVAGTATDWGPNANDGSESGVGRMIGRFGNALTVAGSGGVTVPHDDALETIEEVTVELWMRHDGPTSDIEVLAAKGEPASFGMLLYTDLLLFGFDDDSGTEWAAMATGVTDGEWHHVVGVFDGTELALYVDGSLAGSTPTFGAMPTTNTSPIAIGSFYGAGGFLNGEIDQLHVFDRSLSASEVVDQFAAGESCPLGDNLALMADTSASSTLNPLFRSDNVIDDDTQEAGIADYTMWLGETGESGWVTLDFGAVVGVLRVRWANTHNRTAYDRATTDYRIEASVTGAFGDEAIPIASGTGELEDDLVFHTEESTPVAARYLRFYADDFEGSGPGLNEIQVYGLE